MGGGVAVVASYADGHAWGHLETRSVCVCACKMSGRRTLLGAYLFSLFVLWRKGTGGGGRKGGREKEMEEGEGREGDGGRGGDGRKEGGR